MKIAERCVICDSTDFVKRPGQLAPFISYRLFPLRPINTIAEVIKTMGSRKSLRPFRPLIHLMAAAANILGVGRKFFPIMIGALHCRNCSLLFSDLRSDDEELDRIYSDYRGPQYMNDRERFEPGYIKLNPRLGDAGEVVLRTNNLDDVLARARITPANIKTVLDYGGDEGQFIPASFTAARKIVYEISNKKNAPGIEKTFTLRDIPPVDFALICHVLEHVAYPKDTLMEVKSLLRPGGLVYIEVPVEHEGLDVPDTFSNGITLFHEHINFFSSRSVSHLLERCGFKILFNETIHLRLRDTPVSIVSAIGERIL